MKSMKWLSLILLATSLASGAVYAKGGNGMGGGMGNTTRPDITRRDQTRTQERVQKRDGSHAGDARRHEKRYEYREQTRSAGTSSSEL
jgi:hypothetical protein